MEPIWHKSYAAGVPASIDFEDITLPEAFARSASRYPDGASLMFQGTTMTFRELATAVSRFAGALTSLGVAKGARVSVILPNIVQTAVAIFGALKVGAQVVMHNPRIDDLQLAEQLNTVESEIVVAWTFLSRDY